MVKTNILGKSEAVPQAYRANFLHLYLDIAWFAVLSGSAIAFVGVFAARQGASALQIGLLNAGPAVVNLLFTLPAGQWLRQRPISGSVFWTAVFHRLAYVVWIFLPAWLLPAGQVQALILLTLLMSVPGTGLAIGFNALFASAVPAGWRSHVTGVRNVLLSVGYIGASLLCGWLLDVLPFPLGYQVVFGLGALGAALSTLHLWFVRPLIADTQPLQRRRRGLVVPGLFRIWGDSTQPAMGLRLLARGRSWRRLLNVSVLNGRYGQIMLALFFFHLTQHLATPLYPLYWVNRLQLTDQHIGLGNALFYFTVLLGSMPLARLTARHGYHRLLGAGALLLSLYPALTAMTRALPLFLVTSVVGGFAWALVSGVIANYLLDQMPDDDRPAHLAWYNMALNGALLLGSLGAPLLAEQFGLIEALVVAAVGRFMAAVAIFKLRE